jgi:hypothetical protein
MTSKAKREVAETKEDISEAKKNALELGEELKKGVKEILDRYQIGVENASYEELKPRKADVKVKLIALAWEPYWRINYKEGGSSKITILKAHDII